MDLRQSPPAMGQKIHRLIRKLTGVQDPYLQAKNRFNQLALKMYPELREQIQASADPFETAVRLAIAGNIIDLGVKSGLAESQVEETIAQSLTEPLDMDALKEFRNATAQAKDILYLGDNAGEIVLDRLLIEQLPCENITFVVKAGPIINDATMEDAEIAGLTDIVTVIDNGSDAPGTILESCSEAFRRRFDEADLVISKGQGNYETLSDVNKDVFFILRAKCPVIARHLGCEVGQMILRRSNAFNDIVDLVKEAK
jgi:uncharacterized protein with ATP-grasp and redox domains